MSLGELRAGVDFFHGGVRIRETYFRDLSPIDGGTEVAFLLHLPDGSSENVSFVFQTFPCRDVVGASAHRGPPVTFRALCGESSVLAAVV